MADDTQPVSQPQADDYSSFLGGAPHEPDLSLEETPAPAEEGGEELEPEQEPGEGQPQVEQAADSEEAEEEEAPSDEAEAEQPPSIEERLKDLTQREAESYQARYPNAWKALIDPKTPEDMKHLLLDKIDGDREIQQRIAAEQEQQFEGEEEPTLEETYEQEQPQAAVPQSVADQRQAYYAGIDNLVKTQFDPQSLKEVGDTLLEMFSVNTKLLEDPNFPEPDKQALRTLMTSVQAGAPKLARYMADTVSTVLPHVLPAALDYVMPGFSRMYERQMYGNAWEGVRAQMDAQGKPLYGGLPAFPAVHGTPEQQKFETMLRQAAQQIPGFDSIVYRDNQGRVLSSAQQAQMKYTLLARVISGQKVSPAVVAQAVATGRRLAGQEEKKRQAGRALGAGQGTAGTFGKGGSGSGEDPLLDALDAEIARQNNNSMPIHGRKAGR